MFPKFGFNSIFIDRIIILHLNKYYFIKFQKHFPDLGSEAGRVKPVVASPNVGCFLRLQLLMKNMS